LSISTPPAVFTGTPPTGGWNVAVSSLAAFPRTRTSRYSPRSCPQMKYLPPTSTPVLNWTRPSSSTVAVATALPPSARNTDSSLTFTSRTTVPGANRP
jgi:hypothetical protein